MEAPLSVALLLLVTLGVFSAAFFFLYPHLRYSAPPVSMNIPTSQVVYRDRNTYYIPVRISMSDNAPPIRICAVNVRYTDATGALRSENVDLRNARDGVWVTFAGGRIMFQRLTINKPTSQTIIVNLQGTGSMRLISLYVYYCILGEATPRWGEELRIPGEHLTP